MPSFTIRRAQQRVRDFDSALMYIAEFGNNALLCNDTRLVLDPSEEYVAMRLRVRDGTELEIIKWYSNGSLTACAGTRPTQKTLRRLREFGIRTRFRFGAWCIESVNGWYNGATPTLVRGATRNDRVSVVATHTNRPRATRPRETPATAPRMGQVPVPPEMTVAWFNPWPRQLYTPTDFGVGDRLYVSRIEGWLGHVPNYRVENIRFRESTCPWVPSNTQYWLEAYLVDHGYIPRQQEVVMWTDNR